MVSFVFNNSLFSHAASIICIIAQDLKHSDLRANIVIASTLKPVIDPRAYEKIGRSLAKTGKYSVHIIGALPSTSTPYKWTNLYPYKSKLPRFLMPWVVFYRALKIKPKILVIATHELIFVGFLGVWVYYKYRLS